MQNIYMLRLAFFLTASFPILGVPAADAGVIPIDPKMDRYWDRRFGKLHNTSYKIRTLIADGERIYLGGDDFVFRYEKAVFEKLRAAGFTLSKIERFLCERQPVCNHSLTRLSSLDRRRSNMFRLGMPSRLYLARPSATT